MDGLPVLTASRAEAFAATALANVAQEYPHRLDHVMASDGDVRAPRGFHPSFHGSFDWHSCVHMHWLLVHVRRRFPQLAAREQIDRVFDCHFAPDAIAAECAYLSGPHTLSFERTYGWAWLLKLATELGACEDADARRWTQALAPLAEAIVARYLAYLPRARYPIRYGIHPNSAFGLAFAADYARAARVASLETACAEAARRWFLDDRDAPAVWEPSGADFLSPVLMEAELMRRLLAGEAYGSWLERLLPGIASRAPATLFTPAEVTDRADPQIVHLDGLNLSRAWCWRGVGTALPPSDPRRRVALHAASVHLVAGLEALDGGGEYVATHWLASFAALALSAGDGVA